MATYDPNSLGIKPPSGGFQQGGWYSGRQYWGGTLSDPGVIHPSSNQQGAGQAVSAEVNAQSAQQQGVSAQQLEAYLQQQRNNQATMGVAPGTSGWGAETGASMPGGSGLGLDGLGAPPAINLPDLYKNLYQTAGIEDLNKQYSDMEKTFVETKGKINDNPFLSEATRVGRVAKLETLFNERTANIKNDIATKKADIETQLNLQAKQFDINSQTAKDNLERLNTLLEMGALAGASGEDIANLTRLTGISSGAIYSAIRAKQEKDIDTQIITATADDGTVTATVVNTKTGAIIAKNNLGQIGNKQTGGSGSTKVDTTLLNNKAVRVLDANKNSYGHVPYQAWQQILSAYIQDGGTRESFISNFSNYADPNRGDFIQTYGFENPKKPPTGLGG